MVNFQRLVIDQPEKICPSVVQWVNGLYFSSNSEVFVNR